MSIGSITVEDALRLLKEGRDKGVRLTAALFLADIVNSWAPVPDDFSSRLQELYVRERELAVATALYRVRNGLRMRSRAMPVPPGKANLETSDIELLSRALSELRAFEAGVETGLPAFEDNYRDLELMREGGMGRVFRGFRKEDGRPVALKFLADAFWDNPGVRKRFEREYRLLREMRHPNIIRVHEYHADERGCCIVMDFVRGPDLERWIQTNPVDVPKLVNVLRQVCLGLTEVHRLGIVHRDIKPSNILLGGPDHGGQAILTDFGLAKDPSDKGLTRTDTRLGTVEFLSPEQLSCARDVGPASDVYSLGVTAYYMFSGGRYPAGKNYPVLHELNPEIPAFLNDIVERCILRRPEERWASAANIAEALEVYLTPTVVLDKG